MSDKLGLKRNPLASPVMAVVLLGWPVALTAVAPAQQGVYESRKALEASAAGSQDPEVLTRLAAAQEVYADRAPATYLRLADQFMLGSPERAHALERGFALALRDGNLTQARSFALFLDGSGHPQAYALLGERVAPDNNAVVPGGLAGLAYVAQLPRGTGYHRLLAEFARQVASTVCWKCQGDRLTPKVLAYFAAITSLEAEGERNLNEVSITLSLNGNAERERTDSALHDLGLRLRNDKGQIRLEREKESVTKKPDMAAALAVDVAGVQAALEAGKPYVLKIQDEPAAVYPSAKLWKDSFPKADQRQFALTLLGDPV